MRTLIVTIFLSLSLFTQAQLYDAQWALGYNESVLDFSGSDSISIYSIPTLQYSYLTSASICDELGNLLYYTNGVNICGANSIISNGTGLCQCTAEDSLGGLSIPQAALFIPFPGNSRYYYLFHFSNDSLQGTRPGNIFYSIIDKEGNNNLGEVTQKNMPILRGHALREGGMTACKHANGRDYWLIMAASVDNQFYKFLITPDGVMGPYIQNIGPQYPMPYDIAYSEFSQDGSRFVTGAFEGLILVMDFDRCSGEFSNPVTIFNNTSTTMTQLSGCAAMDFSPNGRFIYVSDNNKLVQYDLSSADLQDTVQLYLEDSSTFYGTYFIQAAPNGKLYVSTWGGGLYALSVINYPNLKGDSAGFVYGGQPTLTLNSANLPNLINYKLGPLYGSGCDTIPNAIPEVKTNELEPRVIPNPADKYAYVEMSMQGSYEFDLLNVAGQVIDKRETKQVDIFDTEHLASGVYFLRVVDKTTGAEIAAKKVLVVH